MSKIKTIIKKIIKILHFNLYLFKCKSKGQVPYIIFGTPLHGNLGDHAIIYSEIYFLKQNGKKYIFEVSTYEDEICFDYICKKLKKDARIFITGGGSIGSQWIEEEKFIRKVIKSFPDNKIVIFPQTVYYSDDENGKYELEISKKIYNGHKNLSLCLREKVSYEFCKSNFQNVNIVLVPDIVLCLYGKKFKQVDRKDDILICFRHDAEKKMSSKEFENITDILKKYGNLKYTDTVIKKVIYPILRKKFLFEKLIEFSSSRLVVTDRLHGMIFAAITKTPCIVFSNYNHKVKGVYSWIKDLNYIVYMENEEELEEKVSALLKLHEEDFNTINLEVKFNDLKKLIKE